ncbi:hypothetical protein BDW59DRAFT_157024 [Aspergillus cavernicola]|uniref:Xylanolytic transcriptional activator regulatory domain-containing protein n=1 Tax=Aspergillus cavernicola TaxID=176166 RepID=A0ABR4IYR2_9EURO
MITPLDPDLINAVLREIRKKRPIFLYSFPLNDLSLVERLCQPVHSPHQPLPSTHLACMNGVLYFILREFAIFQNPLGKKFKLEAFISQCEANFNALLQTYDVLGVPSFGNILALTLGFIKFHDQAKPLLSNPLISAAASHCQTLGYNHDSGHGNSSNSRRLFWSVYMLEKQHCFFFGRASSIQDNDIDANYPVHSRKPPLVLWDELLFMGIQMAKIQSKIYEGLYSKSALGSSGSAREKKVAELRSELKHWLECKLLSMRLTQNNPSLPRLSKEIWEVKYYSILTTLLRAPTASAASTSNPGQTHLKPECFKVARLALNRFLRCWSRVREFNDGDFKFVEMWANWDLISSILTPFIVITLHAIASSNSEEISLLKNVVTTLQSIQLPPHNTSIPHLSKICASFTKVANGLVQQQTSVGPSSGSGPDLGWRYSQREDLLKFDHTHFDNKNEADEKGVKRPASSVFSFGSDEVETKSLFGQVMDTDVLDHVGEAEAEELFAIMEAWIGGLLPGMQVFGGLVGTI